MINISYYGDIIVRTLYDDNFQTNLQILKEEELILNYNYEGKKSITSDDNMYETFYKTDSY